MSTKSRSGVNRLLIVDDHPIVRHGLTEMFAEQTDLEVCGEAASAADALQEFDKSKPDLVLIDISLDGVNGIELIKQIKARDEHAKMLVSSMHDESLYAERALRAGALGYINKAEDREKLLRAVREVLAGRLYLSEKMSERLLHRFVASEQEPDRPEVDSLSDRELEVLQLIGQGFTTREIASKLHLSPKTIETYREHIKSKLELANSSELMRYAVKWTLEQSR